MAKSKEKVTITVDAGLLGALDALVQRSSYASRSEAMEVALEGFLRRRQDAEFEMALLGADAAEEQALAEEGVEAWGAELDAIDGGWPVEGRA